MDSTAYVVFLVVALVLVCWVAVHFLTRDVSRRRLDSPHTRRLSDDTQ